MPERDSVHAMRTMVLSAILSAIGVLGSGCSSTVPPDMKVTEVTVGEQNAGAMVLSFALEGSNENAFPLPLGDIRYRLELDGDRVFQGNRSAQITIPRSGTGIIELPAAFEWDTSARDLQGGVPYRLVCSVRYRPDGTFPGVLYDSDFHRPSRTYSFSGMLDFNAVQQTGPFPGDLPESPNLNIDEADSF